MNDVISLVLQGFYTSYFLSISLLLYRRIRGDIAMPESGRGQPFRESAVEGNLVWGPWKVKGWMGVLNNVIACVYVVFVWIWSYWPSEAHVGAKDMNYSSLVLGVVVVTSIVYYLIRARKTYRGPIVEVKPETI